MILAPFPLGRHPIARVIHGATLDRERQQVPHYASPAVPLAYLLICYRNFQAHNPHYSHVGLGVNALHTARVLREHGVRVDVAPVWTAADVTSAVDARPDLTHTLVEAPFLTVADFQALCNAHGSQQFACRVHSQVGFLQVEAGAIKLVRDYLRLQDLSLNFRTSANSSRLALFIERAYRSAVLLLPNLYWEDRVHRRPYRPVGKMVRVGSFGCIRLLKNHITAAAGALMLASTHNMDLEFYLSVNREEHGRGVIQAIRNLFDRVPYATLVEVPWQSWAEFRQTIALMDLHIQVSTTETFNIVSADAIAEGVPSVSGDALDWVPEDWVVPIDDAGAVARKGYQLISDPYAGDRGLDHLRAYGNSALGCWLTWLGGSPLVKTMPSHHLA